MDARLNFPDFLIIWCFNFFYFVGKLEISKLIKFTVNQFDHRYSHISSSHSKDGSKSI